MDRSCLNDSKNIDRQTEIINRVKKEHISMRTKLVISFNRGKINAIGVKKSYFCHTFHLRPKKVIGGGWSV